MSKHQGPTLAELEAMAFGQPAQVRKFTPQAAQHQVNVVKGLVDIRKAGLLQAIHANAGLLAIELPGVEQKGVRHRITWATAERMVQEFRERQRVDSRNMGVQKKPPERAKTPAKRRTSRR